MEIKRILGLNQSKSATSPSCWLRAQLFLNNSTPPISSRAEMTITSDNDFPRVLRRQDNGCRNLEKLNCRNMKYTQDIAALGIVFWFILSMLWTAGYRLLQTEGISTTHI